MLQSVQPSRMASGSGEEALGLARDSAEPIDLLATDVMMPGMSGLELSQRLRAERPELPVLYLSGYAADVLPEALPAGTRFLPKPFTSQGLLEELVYAGKKGREGFTGAGRRGD